VEARARFYVRPCKCHTRDWRQPSISLVDEPATLLDGGQDRRRDGVHWLHRRRLLLTAAMKHQQDQQHSRQREQQHGQGIGSPTLRVRSIRAEDDIRDWPRICAG
jgi:hypothetical protein